MKKNFFLSIVTLLSLLSCSNRSLSKIDIDKFILQNDTISFLPLKGLFIAQRSSSLDEIVYIIDKFDENKPPYFVTYSIARNNVTEINRSLLEKGSVMDYLSEDDINKAVSLIRKYGYYLLAVDTLNNVFINPFQENSPAFFLRVHTSNGDSIINNGGFLFIYYQDKWYINKENL